MKVKIRGHFIRSGIMFLLFSLFTAVALNFDVRSIGPQQSNVGFATMNEAVFNLFGENMLWDKVTDLTAGVAIIVALGFVLLGIAQLITRKSVKRVNAGILAMGILYAAIAVFYVIFEMFVVNYRPVVVDAALEASYPSTHTMISFCIMASAMMRFRSLLKKTTVRMAAYVISVLIIAITVIGRLLAGVHWFTDVVGGLLLGTALVLLYYASVRCIEYRRKVSKK